MLFTSFLFTSFPALVKYGNIDQIRQKLYYHWCDREEKLLLFPEFVSRSARFLKVMRETAVHSFPDSRSPFPVPGSRFPVPGFSNIHFFTELELFFLDTLLTKRNAAAGNEIACFPGTQQINIQLTESKKQHSFSLE